MSAEYADVLFLKSDPVQVTELASHFVEYMNKRVDSNASRVCALGMAILVVCEGADGTEALEQKSEAVIEYVRRLVRERLGKPQAS